MANGEGGCEAKHRAREEKEVFLTVWRVTLRSSSEPRHGITTRSPSRTNTISYSFSDGTNGTLGSENIPQVSDTRQRATLAVRIIHPLRWASLQCDQQSANRTLANVAHSATSRWNHFYSFQCYNSHVIVTLKEHLPHILFFAFVSIDRSLVFDAATSVFSNINYYIFGWRLWEWFCLNSFSTPKVLSDSIESRRGQ